MTASQPSESPGAAPRDLTLRLGAGTWQMIEEKAAQEGVTADELIVFSVLYYLADVDSGRISRRISRSPYPTPPGDRASDNAGLGATALSPQTFTAPG